MIDEKILVKVKATDGMFDAGEIFWIEKAEHLNIWVCAEETKNRLTGTTVTYTDYEKLYPETHPEYYL